jgi:hypothetical protein
LRSAATILLLAALPSTALGDEWSGHTSVEVRLFTTDQRLEDQSKDTLQGSLVVQPRLQAEVFDEGQLYFEPFFRVDTLDSARTHWDIRELRAEWGKSGWRVSVGVDTVFWGVTESQHLVDVINQVDGVDRIDEEARRGQPMVFVGHTLDWAHLGVYAMPFFRERTFPSVEGRLRTEIPVDPALSSVPERHALAPDGAARFRVDHRGFGMALSHFYGVGRTPSLEPALDERGHPVLAPVYAMTHQSGLEAEYVAGGLHLKGEGIRVERDDEDEPWYALTAGFEYTFLVRSIEWGLLSEWLYDTRQEDAPTPFENDLMFGFRLFGNDIWDTRLLVGVIKDLDTPGWTMWAEGCRRLSDRWRMEVEIRVFVDTEKEDPLHALRYDDYLAFRIGRYL